MDETRASGPKGPEPSPVAPPAGREALFTRRALLCAGCSAVALAPALLFARATGTARPVAYNQHHDHHDRGHHRDFVRHFDHHSA